MNLNDAKIAKDVFETEISELQKISDSINREFSNAVEEIYNSKGRLIISGMGKSGLIGKKISATLASTGTPSYFVHPSEAYHGDLGNLRPEDVILLLSNSEETDEVLKLVPFLETQGNKVISITGNKHSTLAKNSTHHIEIKVEKEACPLQLAPTSSTTATLVMGDALAVALMKRNQFQELNFAKFHHGGSLGRRLITRVKDVMQKKDIPICNIDENAINIIHIISKSSYGLVIVMDNNEIIGAISDGDIRRCMEEKEKDFFDLKAKDVMSKNPKIILPDTKLAEAQSMMTKHKINNLIVATEKGVEGIVQIFDVSF